MPPLRSRCTAAARAATSSAAVSPSAASSGSGSFSTAGPVRSNRPNGVSHCVRSGASFASRQPRTT